MHASFCAVSGKGSLLCSMTFYELPCPEDGFFWERALDVLTFYPLTCVQFTFIPRKCSVNIQYYFLVFTKGLIITASSM